MRNILVFLVVTMVSGPLFAQHEFISNKNWGVIDTQISPENQSVISYSFKGDTLINGEEYVKVSESRINPVVSNEILSLFVRESNSSRVYLYDSNNQIERLLYDFNLQEGDSFDISIDSREVPFIVTEVDSV